MIKRLVLYSTLRTVFSMSRFVPRVEIDGSNHYITVHPIEGKHSATMFLMHGLGDTADGWLDTAEEIVSRFPYIKIVLPTAESRSVTLNMGAKMPAWYDITGLTADRASEDCDGLPESIATIKSLMESENSIGISYKRMMLGGFSQGGALTLATGLQLPVDKKPAGLLVMSGYLPAASKFNLTPGLEDVPILHTHGDVDPVVQYNWAIQTKDAIISRGAKNYELKTYSRLGHGINQELLEYAQNYISRVLIDDPSLALKPKEFSEMSVKELKIAIRNYGLASQALGFSEKNEFVKLLEDYRTSKG